MSRENLIARTSGIVGAYVSNNSVPIGELAALIKNVHGVLDELATSGTTAAQPREPAVPVKRSIMPDYVVCLEDGKKLKMLKRYLRTRYDMTPEQYRAKWGLPVDYPMVAPNYARVRSDFAKRIGLGRTPAKRAKR